MPEASVIELRAGRGDPRQISLTPGSVLDPTSVGQTGMWRLEGNGVLDVHGYFYFDGKALFVQSADDASPVMVNRHRVARAWTEVRMPSTIELGEVQLVYRIDTAVFEDGDQTVAQPMEDSNFEPMTVRFDPNRHRSPAPRPAAGTPAEGIMSAPAAASPNRAAFVPGGGAFAGAKDDNESTRYKPIEVPPDRASQPNFPPQEHADMTRAEPLQVPGYAQAAQPGFPPQGALPPGMIGVGPSGGPGSPAPQPGSPWGNGSVTGPGNAAQPATGGSFLDKIKREFNTASPVKRLALALFPFALVAGGVLVLTDEEPAATPETKSAKSAAVASSVVPGPSAAQTPVGANAGTQGAGATAAGSGQNPSTPPPVTPPPPAGGNPPPVVAKPTAPAQAEAAPGVTVPSSLPPLTTVIPMSPKKSLERQAADAVAEGQYDVAAKLYEQLAASNPGNPAYKEAARILREHR